MFKDLFRMQHKQFFFEEKKNQKPTTHVVVGCLHAL